jgi:hypothetical protein
MRTLNVDQAILVSSQPVSQTLCVGSTAIFTVVADANGDPLTYQWKKNGTDIGGATSATLTLTNITAADAASYTVLITGPAGYSCPSLLSSAATLTVTANATIYIHHGCCNYCANGLYQ